MHHGANNLMVLTYVSFSILYLISYFDFKSKIRLPLKFVINCDKMYCEFFFNIEILGN